jgi:SAM-dependent methyltransferase
VAGRYPAVRFERIAHSGLSAARNAGLRLARTAFIIFLDADDLLHAGAIEAGLRCMAANPGAGFVYGGHRLVDQALGTPRVARIRPIGPRAHYDLLGLNPILMHGAVLYDRAKLTECGAFDETLSRCEDYDVYLRMTRRYRAVSHSETVADYRIHPGGMSVAVGEQYKGSLAVHARCRPPADERALLARWKRGRRVLTRNFARSVWGSRAGIPPVQRWAQRREMLRIAPAMSALAAIRQMLISSLPWPVAERLRAIRRKTLRPRSGAIDFGDFLRIAPLSPGFGFRRGTPVDRWYIEQFLAQHGNAIRGRVLEVGDDAYSRRFGTGVTRQDVLNVKPGRAGTTIVGDLAQAGALPADTFDCIVLTQTLHLLYDMPAAVRRLHEALRPGGVLLATVPGISPVDPGEWGETWFWSLTATAARRLFGEVFGADAVEVAADGNAFAATCFLQGVALEDIEPHWLRPADPSYPVVVTVRARKGG